MLLKSPGFTIVAVLTLALGIGVNSAIFSVVDTVLLRPLSFPDPDQIVMIWGTRTNEPNSRETDSFPDFYDYRAQSQSFSAMTGYSSAGTVLNGVGEAQEQERLETWIMAEVGRDAALPGLYPPNAENRARYEKWKMRPQR